MSLFLSLTVLLFQVIEPINNEIQIISTSYYKQGFDISPSRTPIGKIVDGDWTPSHLAERQTPLITSLFGCLSICKSDVFSSQFPVTRDS